MSQRPKPDIMRGDREFATESARGETVANRPPQPSRWRGGCTRL